MRRTLIIPEALLIPVFTLLATVLLGMTSHGAIFATLPGYGKEERIAQVTLSGIEKSKVEMAIAEGEKSMWVRMRIESVEGGEGGEGAEGPERSRGMKITLPASWHLEEVRGIHARDIAREKVGEQMQLMIRRNGQWTMDNGKLEFLFTTLKPFDSLHFSHDSVSLALLKITRLPSSGNAPEEIVKFVEEGVTVAL